jgi:hypothetical protein
MNFPRSTGAFGILLVGAAASAVALMSSRIDRALFYILSSGSMILAVLMASAFLKATVKVLAFAGARNREHSADNTDQTMVAELKK